MSSRDSDYGKLTYTGQNWEEFEIWIQAIALDRDCMGFLDGISPPYDKEPTEAATPAEVEKYRTKKNKMWATIVINLGSFATIAKSVEPGNARALWQAIQKRHTSDTNASIKQMLKRTLAITQGNDTVPEFDLKLQIQIDELNTAIKRRNVDPITLIHQMLLVEGLDSRYALLKESLFLDNTRDLPETRAIVIEQTQRIDMQQPSTTRLLQTKGNCSELFALLVQRKAKQSCRERLLG